MSGMSLQLDAAALQQATVQAMLNAMTPEVKEQLLQNAIKHILTPSTTSWDKGKSPVEQVFEAAATQVARQEAERLFKEDPEVQAKVQVLIRKVADRLLGNEIDDFANKIADSIAINIRNR